MTPPGAELAGLLAEVNVERVSGFDTVEVLKAAYRQVCHDRAWFLRALLEVGLRDSFSGDDVVRLEVPDEFGPDEARAALVWSRRRADSTFELAWNIHRRLPILGEAMLAGTLDEPRAVAFVRWTVGLTDEQAALVCDQLVPQASSWTVGELIERIQRLALAIDPAWAERRYTEAVRRRRVVGTRNEDGTATVSGLDLPLDRAAAGCDRIDELARACKRAGDRRPIDHIRVDLFLGSLDGTFEGMSDEEIVTHVLCHPFHDTLPSREGDDDNGSGGDNSGERGSDGGGDGPDRPGDGGGVRPGADPDLPGDDNHVDGHDGAGSSEGTRGNGGTRSSGDDLDHPGDGMRPDADLDQRDGRRISGASGADGAGGTGGADSTGGADGGGANGADGSAEADSGAAERDQDTEPCSHPGNGPGGLSSASGSHSMEPHSAGSEETAPCTPDHETGQGEAESDKRVPGKPAPDGPAFDALVPDEAELDTLVPDQVELDRSALDKVGPDKAELDRSAPGKPAPDGPAFDTLVPDEAELDALVPDQAELDRSAPDTLVPDTLVPDKVGPNGSGPGQAGTGRAGPCRSAPDKVGPDRPTPDEAGPARPAPGEAGADRVGLQHAHAQVQGDADVRMGTGGWTVREIRLELTTLLSLDEHPAHLPGWGVVHPGLARCIVEGMLGGQWRYAICYDNGHLALTGLVRARPHAPGRNRPARDRRRGGLVELQITLSHLRMLAARPARVLGAWAPVVAELSAHAASLLATGEGVTAGRHMNGMADRRAEGTAGGGADSERRRQAGAALRRYVQIRGRVCSWPGCRTPATRTDQDHILPWAEQGPTNAENLHLACRHDHRARHHGGWRVSTAGPHMVVWTSPLGHRYPSPLPKIIIPACSPHPRSQPSPTSYRYLDDLPETPTMAPATEPPLPQESPQRETGAATPPKPAGGTGTPAPKAGAYGSLLGGERDEPPF
ncbi:MULTISPECIES: HNH endonuclease signature motif containing protein [unclassified Microbispora]|uniref:HNH endonuclease signature motif containing protein n=1 Tax=unclassified Microbispora TaxID=2614687 RepID=UPI00143BCB45|nr:MULTISPECIES: HNH endonuclease signature motif containing protein [unclassified Microbispora]NJP23878.1 DUF222 domain-containing protein [Microbispora sp. CL1-1]